MNDAMRIDNDFTRNGIGRERSLAMAYVPMQQMDETYSAMRALYAGVLFPELFKPFMGRGRCDRDE